MINLFSNKNSLKRAMIVLTVLSLLFVMTAIVFAGNTGVASFDIDKTIGKILGLVLTVVQYLGVILLVYGIVILILAMRNEDADSKTRATLFLVVSIVLIALRPLLKTLFQTIGLTGISGNM